MIITLLYRNDDVIQSTYHHMIKLSRSITLTLFDFHQLFKATEHILVHCKMSSTRKVSRHLEHGIAWAMGQLTPDQRLHLIKLCNKLNLSYVKTRRKKRAEHCLLCQLLMMLENLDHI